MSRLNTHEWQITTVLNEEGSIDGPCNKVIIARNETGEWLAPGQRVLLQWLPKKQPDSSSLAEKTG